VSEYPRLSTERLEAIRDKYKDTRGRLNVLDEHQARLIFSYDVMCDALDARKLLAEKDARIARLEGELRYWERKLGGTNVGSQKRGS
jgi:hypothetical protein